MQTHDKHKRVGTAPVPANGTGRDQGRDFTQYMTDMAITETLESVLAAETGIHSRHIRVETYYNTVTLTGQVATSGDKEQAAALVRDRENADGVINRLTVRAAH